MECLFLLQCDVDGDLVQKQPSRGVLKKRCSENMTQIYRRTPMPKCDFNKVEGLFESHCFKASRLLDLRTTDTSHVVEYLGRAGLKLKTPFKNLHTKGNSPNGISFSVLIIVVKQI